MSMIIASLLIFCGYRHLPKMLFPAIIYAGFFNMHCCHDNSNVIVLPSSMKELECPRLLRLFFLLTVISQLGTYQLLIIPWGGYDNYK